MLMLFPDKKQLVIKYLYTNAQAVFGRNGGRSIETYTFGTENWDHGVKKMYQMLEKMERQDPGRGQRGRLASWRCLCDVLFFDWKVMKD